MQVELTSELNALKALYNTKDTDLQQLRVDRTALIDQFKAAEKELNSRQKKIASLKETKASLEEKRTLELNALKARCTDKDGEIASLRETHTSLELVWASERLALKTQCTEKNNKIAFLMNTQDSMEQEWASEWGDLEKQLQVKGDEALELQQRIVCLEVSRNEFRVDAEAQRAKLIELTSSRVREEDAALQSLEKQLQVKGDETLELQQCLACLEVWCDEFRADAEAQTKSQTEEQLLVQTKVYFFPLQPTIFAYASACRGVSYMTLIT